MTAYKYAFDVSYLEFHGSLHLYAHILFMQMQ